MTTPDTQPAATPNTNGAGTHENESLRNEQTALLRTVLERLEHIIELLTPKEGSRDGVPLDELLAHLIRQGAEHLALTKKLVESVNRLELSLPLDVVRAMADNFGAAHERRA
jgi:hypothetical protein